MLLAHIFGVPLEESLVPLLSGTAAAALVLLGSVVRMLHGR